MDRNVHAWGCPEIIEAIHVPIYLRRDAREHVWDLKAHFDTGIEGRSHMNARKEKRANKIIALIASLALVVGLMPAPAFAFTGQSGAEAVTSLTVASDSKTGGQLSAQNGDESVGLSIPEDIELATNLINGAAFATGSGPVSWVIGQLMTALFGTIVDDDTQKKLDQVLSKLDEIEKDVKALSDKVTTIQLQTILNDLVPVTASNTPEILFSSLKQIDEDVADHTKTPDEAKAARLTALTKGIGIEDPANAYSDFDQYVDLLWKTMTHQYDVTIDDQPQKFTIFRTYYELMRRTYKWEHQAYEEWASFQGKCVSLLMTTLVLEKASLQARIELLEETGRQNDEFDVQKRLEKVSDMIDQAVGKNVILADGVQEIYPGYFSEKTWANQYWLYKDRSDKYRYYWVPGHEILFYAQVNTQNVPHEKRSVGVRQPKELKGINVKWSGGDHVVPFDRYWVTINYDFWKPFLSYQGGDAPLASVDQLNMIYKDYGKNKHLYDIFIGKNEGNFKGLSEGDITTWYFVVAQDKGHELKYDHNLGPDHLHCTVVQSRDASTDNAILCTYYNNSNQANDYRHYIGIGVARKGPEPKPKNEQVLPDPAAQPHTAIEYDAALWWPSYGDLSIGYDSAALGKVSAAAVDGTAVNAKYYTASTSKKNGGAISLSEKYLAKLRYGKHKLVLTTEKGSHTVIFKVKKAGRSVTIGKTSVKKTFGAKAFNLDATKKGAGKLTYGSSNEKVAKVDAKGKITIKGAGTAKITAMLDETSTYASVSASMTIKVAKAANPLKLATATRTVKASKAKSASLTIAGAKVAKKAKGTVTYSITKAVKGKKSFAKNFGIDKATGKITVKKGTARGIYKVKVKAIAKGSANYKKSTQTAIVTVLVK